MDELKPCPFCGSEAELRKIHVCCEDLYEVRCPDCGCGTDGCDFDWRATQVWNARSEAK